MSYPESIKTEAYDQYVDHLKGGMKEHNILAKIAKEMEIPRETLREWRQSGDWSRKANLDVLKSAKTDFLAILKKLPEHVNSENAAELGRLVLDVMESVNETENQTGPVEQSEDVDDGEIFGDDSAISPIVDTLRERPVDD